MTRQTDADAGVCPSSEATVTRLVPVMPLYLSQLNCEAAVGMRPREFREFIRAQGIPMFERGKGRFVRTSDFVQRFEAATNVNANAKGPVKAEANRERLRRLAGLRGKAEK